MSRISRHHNHGSKNAWSRWRTRSTALVFTVMLGAVSACGTSADAGSDEEIFVGVVTDLTGPTAVVGRDNKRAVDAAVRRINEQGGVEGFGKLRVVYGDAKADPQAAAAAVERMVSQEDVDVLLGAASSAGTSGAAQQAQRMGMLYLNVSATDQSLTERGFDYYLTQQVVSEDIITGAVDYIGYLQDDMGYDLDGVAILYADDAKGNSDRAALAAQAADAGIDVVAEVAYAPGTREWLTTMTKVKSSDADVLVWSGYSEEYPSGIDALGQLRYQPYIIGTGAGLLEPEVAKLSSPEKLEGVKASATTYFSPALPQEPAQTFAEVYEEAYDVEPSNYASSGWQGMFTLVELLEAAGTLDPAELRSAAGELRIPGDETVTPFEYIGFDENGRNTGARVMLQQWQGGDQAIVFPESVASTTPLEP